MDGWIFFISCIGNFAWLERLTKSVYLSLTQPVWQTAKGHLGRLRRVAKEETQTIFDTQITTALKGSRVLP